MPEKTERIDGSVSYHTDDDEEAPYSFWCLNIKPQGVVVEQRHHTSGDSKYSFFVHDLRVLIPLRDSLIAACATIPEESPTEVTP